MSFHCSKKKWTVFYHFIGAAPGSTDIASLIQRFLKKLEYKVSFFLQMFDGNSLTYNIHQYIMNRI